jgi:glycosyltransferase involved in cell wall biosynthesis
MQVTFYSNFLNHHQLPFCMEMQKHLGDYFRFVATSPIPQERLDLGYSDMNKKYPFVITTYDNQDNKAEAMRLAIDSDVIITGSAPEKYVSERIKSNKITFRYSERIYRRGLWRYFSPRGLFYMLTQHTRYRKLNLYMLCASAYTAGDFSMLGAYKDKFYKWGYFPEVISYDIDKLMNQKKHPKIQILWCARFLKLKHPEKVLFLAKYLKAKSYNFHINIIGIGELEQMLKDAVNRDRLQDCISMPGSMPPENVRKYMDDANIFLFTSDYNEGWGAVLNESMNSGCAVVASHAIGSVPFLLKHNENGLIYKNDNIKDFYCQVEKLINDEHLRDKLGRNAYLTLNKVWNAEVATQNFLDLCRSLLNGGENTVKEGPCSKAAPIKQWNMYKHCRRDLI